MVINLPERAKAKWAEAIAARDPVTKLKLLKEFYSSFPKHKGTEKLEVSIKKQIKSLEEEIERSRSRRRGSTRLEWVVKKEGMVQLAILGSLHTSIRFFKFVTNRDINIYEVLHAPVVGVLEGEGIQFQVILTPFDESIGVEKQERIMNLIRNVDIIIVVLGSEGTMYLQRVFTWLEEHNIDIRPSNTFVEIIHTSSGGLRVVNYAKALSDWEVIKFLSSYKIRNAIVKIYGEATLEDVESALFGRVVKKALFIPLDERIRTELLSLIDEERIITSVADRASLANSILQKSGYIRVYTKSLGDAVAEKPLLMKKGARVIDVAEKVHKDLVKFFKYAKVWRGGSLQGVRVGENFLLEDKDIVEIHSS
ncbi:MAG: TGS domain-containing protein [Nitrososphaerota archaeon]|nr:TGS domain-containing protein [Nitrososphaerota archaeon]